MCVMSDFISRHAKVPAYSDGNLSAQIDGTHRPKISLPNCDLSCLELIKAHPVTFRETWAILIMRHFSFISIGPTDQTAAAAVPISTGRCISTRVQHFYVRLAMVEDSMVMIYMDGGNNAQAHHTQTLFPSDAIDARGTTSYQDGVSSSGSATRYY
jgi:hypothetical protein